MDKRKKKGHGCLGFTLTLIVALGALFTVLMLKTDTFDGLKYKAYGLFYQQKYTDQVERYSAEFGVEESLVYAVIRTESGFRPEVESAAGAVGLMQLMPSTFDWLQTSLDGEVIYTADRLSDPDINIRYGTYFISYLIQRYGDLDTACAAYNAGVASVDSWLSDPNYSPDGVTLSEIPYKETERYVEKVKSAKAIYDKLLDDR